MSLEKIYAKRKDSSKFLLCITLGDRQNVLIGLNYTELQKFSTQYKPFLYNKLGITKMFYSV